MSVRLWQIQIAKERIRHRCVVVLSGVNDERQKRFGTLFIAATIGATFMKLGRAPTTLMTFSIVFLATKGHKAQRLFAPVFIVNIFVPFVAIILQTNYARATFAPDLAIQRVARVYDQRHEEQMRL